MSAPISSVADTAESASLTPVEGASAPAKKSKSGSKGKKKSKKALQQTASTSSDPLIEASSSGVDDRGSQPASDSLGVEHDGAAASHPTIEVPAGPIDFSGSIPSSPHVALTQAVSSPAAPPLPFELINPHVQSPLLLSSSSFTNVSPVVGPSRTSTPPLRQPRRMPSDASVASQTPFGAKQHSEAESGASPPAQTTLPDGLSIAAAHRFVWRPPPPLALDLVSRSALAS